MIQQKTTMPVTQVTEPVKVRPNHVYVIPPNHQLTFEGQHALICFRRNRRWAGG